MVSMDKVKFGDVVRLSKARSSDPIADGYDRYIGLDHIEPEDLRIRRWGNVADGVTFTSVFKPGQVLFGKRRAYQRKVAVADFAGVCSGDIYVLESKDPKKLLPELLPFICQTEAFFQHAVGTSAGSLSPRTNWTSLADFEFAMPPLEEQQRILSVLSEIETNADCLDGAIKAANSLFLSLGTEVFQNSYPKAPLANFIAESMYGPRFSNSLYNDNGPIAQLRTTDISEYGQIDYEGIPRADLKQEDLVSHLLQSGDLVFSRSGTCGLTAVFEQHIVPTVPAAFLIRLRLNELMSPYFLHEFFCSPIGKQLSSSLSRGGVQQNVSASELAKQFIPVPTLDEQKSIVERFHEIRSGVNELYDRKATCQAIKRAILTEVS